MATSIVFPLLLLLISSTLLVSGSDPEKRCRTECRDIPEGRQKQECVLRCLTRSTERVVNAGRERQEEEGEQAREHNPYHFGRGSYEHWTRTEHGQFKMLERFSKRSGLLMGIENNRLAVLEAEPQTFIIPSHMDADEVLYVIEGSGIITLLQEENRESHNVKRGDIMKILAGTIVYAINTASNEKLRVAMLLRPVSTPGQVVEFFGAAGRNPQTFYTSFSNAVLEAAFNTPREKLERLFGRQRKGEIIKINQEEIRALSESAKQGGGWPFGLSNEPFNLLKKRPTHSNQHGALHEATAQDCEQLRELDMDVSFVNITKGSMTAPLYNSRSTKVAMVVGGSGYVEMACPHRSGQAHGRGEEARESEGQRRVLYRTVRSQVATDSVFVIPAGHPVAIVAAPNENLQVICFGIRAERNRKNYLAGRNNVLNNLDREAKQLAFGAGAHEVEEILNAQRESVFLPGPEHHRREEVRGRQASLESLFNFFEGF